MTQSFLDNKMPIVKEWKKNLLNNFSKKKRVVAETSIDNFADIDLNNNNYEVLDMNASSVPIESELWSSVNLDIVSVLVDSMRNSVSDWNFRSERTFGVKIEQLLSFFKVGYSEI